MSIFSIKNPRWIGAVEALESKRGSLWDATYEASLAEEMRAKKNLNILISFFELFRLTAD